MIQKGSDTAFCSVMNVYARVQRTEFVETYFTALRVCVCMQVA